MVVLPGWRRGDIRPREQAESRATQTRRLSRDDGRIDWSRPAAEIARRVRAYDPWPGSFTYWRGKMLKMSGGSVLPNPPRAAGPGEVVPIQGGIGIGTGDDLIAPGSLQIEGRRPVEPAEFARGYRDFVGTTLGK